jgi:hypothetical protein
MKIFTFLNFLDLQGKFTQSDRLLSKISIAAIDPLKVLGLDSSATFEDVKNKYKVLARKYHPDFNPGGEDEMIQLNIAYDLIKNNPDLYLSGVRTEKQEKKKLVVQEVQKRELPRFFLSGRYESGIELKLIFEDGTQGYLIKYILRLDPDYAIEWTYDGQTQIIPESEKVSWNEKFQSFEKISKPWKISF